MPQVFDKEKRLCYCLNSSSSNEAAGCHGMVLHPHWNYTVSSGYRVASVAREMGRGVLSTSSTMVVCRLWRLMLGLKLMGKIKPFVWGVLIYVMPCNELLFRWHIAPCPSCPLCGGGFETITHALRQYPVAVEVWKILKVADIHKNYRTMEVIEMMWFVLMEWTNDRV